MDEETGTSDQDISYSHRSINQAKNPTVPTMLFVFVFLLPSQKLFLNLLFNDFL